ncbi:MAG: glutathione S-transferase N-terminal domain-containing protein [Sphingomonadales bacterium]|nr:glutathione S-transferase N-terminal domain-containing protein [Sphingomonadales bacterium]
MNTTGVIELYGMSSPNVRKVLIALEEMALPYRVIHVPVFRGAQFRPEFLALNPMAKVPVLVDAGGPAAGGPAAGEPLFESGAILVYLAEAYGPQFLPATGPTRYAVLKWLFLQVANVGPALGNHGHFKGQAEGNAYAAGRFRRMAAQVFRACERRLGETRYLGGDDYSIADMAAHPWLRRFKRFGLDLGEFPGLSRWTAEIAARPAVLRSDAVVRQLGETDSADIAAASEADMAMFTGRHIVAPTAGQAATVPPWWKGRTGA